MDWFVCCCQSSFWIFANFQLYSTIQYLPENKSNFRMLNVEWEIVGVKNVMDTFVVVFFNARRLDTRFLQLCSLFRLQTLWLMTASPSVINAVRCYNSQWRVMHSALQQVAVPSSLLLVLSLLSLILYPFYARHTTHVSSIVFSAFSVSTEWIFLQIMIKPVIFLWREKVIIPQTQLHRKSWTLYLSGGRKDNNGSTTIDCWTFCDRARQPLNSTSDDIIKNQTGYQVQTMQYFAVLHSRSIDFCTL